MWARASFTAGFIGVDREEQIGQVANLAETMGAEVKIIKGVGFTDEIIGGLMAAMVEPEPRTMSRPVVLLRAG